MTKKQFKERFDKAIELPWDESLKHCHAIYIVPTRKKHESGYTIMNMLIELADGRDVKEQAHCDDIGLHGKYFRIDCDYPSGIIRIWNGSGFHINSRLSSIDLIEGIDDKC